MKTKNILKALVLASVLVSACGKNEIADDIKGYTLPVTINITRQGDDATTRATYTYDEDTKKGTLSFSAGDKLFVEGRDDNTAGSFKGVLTWVSGGTFSGSINTKNKYTGTADALLTDAAYVTATLLPAGYESYAFLSIEDETDCSGWVGMDLSKAFAPTKKAAVEQFSYERATSYSSGFALSPDNAIVSFTISGLAADAGVAVLFKDAYDTGATPVNVTTDASGVATFAVAVYYNDNIDYYTLTVDGIDITLPDKTAEKGHIYNISRSVAPAGPTAYTLAESTVGMIVGSDGKAYDVADKDNLPSGVTAVAMVAYKSGSNGLAIQLNSSPVQKNWADAKTYAEGLTAVTGGTWRLPSKADWQNMFVGCAVSGDASSNNYYMSPIAGFKAKIAATGITWQSVSYWSSTDSYTNAWVVGVYLNGYNAYAGFDEKLPSLDFYVLGCLAF